MKYGHIIGTILDEYGTVLPAFVTSGDIPKSNFYVTVSSKSKEKLVTRTKDDLEVVFKKCRFLENIRKGDTLLIRGYKREG